MDKDTRNAIERATQRARKLLEEDFSAQLEGDFDVHRNGAVAVKAGSHLSTRQVFQRERVVAAIKHKRGAGMSAPEAVADYLRDAAFTTFNRFVALKMLEARELVQECITKGQQSSGYREFCGLAQAVPLLPDSAGYRLYIESLFDELSTEVKVLFDRRDPSSVLWPKRATFEELLEILNAGDIAGVWGEDETIGWVYQFFNESKERREMREESPAPRTSRELAVRNQFFTPRYVVQFLTDNTLGRIWYEMCSTRTALAERCEYMVLTSGEEFVPPPKKDPRDLRVLDPACGSGHFLLYAFDLLLTIYEEAYADPESPKSLATGQRLAEDYPTFDTLRKAAPGLILAHNLYGVDIDPRCAQIAQVALWMRAQRAYHDVAVGRAERPRVRRSNIVVAEPLVADDELAGEFVTRLEDPELGRVFMTLVDTLRLAGDLGLLLRVEMLMTGQLKPGQSDDLFVLPEERIRATLDRFIAEREGRASTRRQLFMDDTAQGVGLLEIAEKKFDAVLMNPPFGDCTAAAKSLLFSTYGRERIDLGGCFVTRFLGLLSRGGRLGVIANRTLLFAATLDAWRKEHLSGATTVVDLGHGVLDALVETAAFTVGNEPTESTLFVGALDSLMKSEHISASVRAVREGDASNMRSVSDFAALFGAPFAYWVTPHLLRRLSAIARVEDFGLIARSGLQTCDNFRFLRLRWEIPQRADNWPALTKGGEYQPFWADVPLRINWAGDGRQLKSYIEQLYGQWSKQIPSSELYGYKGATYSERTTSSLSLRLLPPGCLFDKKGPFVGSADEHADDSITLALIGLSYTTPYRFFVETAVGLRDSTSSGSPARDYLPSMIQRLPIGTSAAENIDELASLTLCAALAQRDLAAMEETCVYRVETCRWYEVTSVESLATQRFSYWLDGIEKIYLAADRLEAAAVLTLGLDREDLSVMMKVSGSSPLYYSRDSSNVSDDRLMAHLRLPDEELISKLAARGDGDVSVFKKSHWGDRKIELLSHLYRIHPLAIVSRLRGGAPSSHWIVASAIHVLSTAFGIAIGRFNETRVFECAPIKDDIKAPLPHRSSAERGDDVSDALGILVDDLGSRIDVVAAIDDVLARGFPASPESMRGELERALELSADGLRVWLRKEFFSLHLGVYSLFRRRAPLYWQLATPSASYSVWLYIHAFTKDTLFRVQNDYVGPKLAHEERRLESMTREQGAKATAAERKARDSQETLVQELRALLDEVKRVAPLWKPNLDDGVIINFALLWRLVPQHKPWQKELKATWDALSEGKYDWAHLAMHLWPERVVPKCASDRSLAIAHGLEEEFWVDSSDRKWIPRKSPKTTLDGLIRERTSPAVKAALRGLLEVSPSTCNSGRSRGVRHRPTANADEQGGG
jgi:hypothetical protein